jgi:hypothetical protein
LEARVGIEPTHKGFADRFLATPNPSDSTQVFIKLVFRPLFVRLGHEYSSDSGKARQNPQTTRNNNHPLFLLPTNRLVGVVGNQSHLPLEATTGITGGWS